MHLNELKIKKSLVLELIKSQCPQWAHLPIKPILSKGTDHALFRLGEEYVVRLPRIDRVVKNIQKEYEWVPQLARLLKRPISKPLFQGSFNEFYPWPWLVVQWNEGQNPHFEIKNEFEPLAKDLAEFLNELHSIQLFKAPFSRRGVSLKEVDEPTRDSLRELENELDIEKALSLWSQFLNVPFWEHEPVWVHGDFLPSNVLVQKGRLSAVIDFSDTGLGDPACDLIISWSLFNRSSRKVFKNFLKNLDENTWQRGRGWAFSIAVILLPYYKHSNPYLVALARRMIKNILSEDEDPLFA